MPPVYGGAPKCPTCNKSVYAAEQVLGPAGTYHKLCLKCVACGKLLEPRLLVDHDGQAYCKACHGKSYGTKGYGAGGALVGVYAPRPPDPASPTKVGLSSPAPAPALPPRPAAEPNPPEVPSRPLSGSSAASTLPTRAPTLPARPPSDAPRSLPPPVGAPPDSRGQAPSLPGRPAPPPKPASFASRADAAGPASSDAALTTSGKAATPAFDEDDQRGPLAPSGRSSLTSPTALADSLSSLSIPTRSRPSLTAAAPSLANPPSLCPACAKPVYHAERVQALGRAWHRACLRCSGCGTGLGSQPGRVEEKEGRPWCRRCYQGRWGITGGMGMSTRPGLY